MKIRTVKFPISAAVLMAAICLLFASGCARIADPEPPEVLIPRAATDLAAAQIADSVVLTITLPTQNTDGFPASTLKTMEVFRVAQSVKEKLPALPMRPLTEKEFLAQATQILSIPSSRFSSYLHNKTLIIRDTPQPQANTGLHSQLFRYAVIFANKKGQAAGLSNQVSIQLISIPPAPEGISVQTTENAVVLKWRAPYENADGSKPASIAGYNIYRSEQADSFSPLPINTDPLQQTEFQDRNFEFDKTYFYAISTIGSLKEPFAESLHSTVVEVKPRDVFPPAPPEDFNSVFENNKVVLLWTPSTSSDVSGYRIYRQEKETSSRQLLQEALITGLSYQDRGIELNKTYEYSIQAVDTHGNESSTVRTEVTTR
jgi:hypothetical protein